MTPEQKARVSIDALLTAAGCGRKHLRGSDAERLPVPLPPVAEQARITTEVARHLSITCEAEVDVNLQRAQALLQLVLSKAFHTP